MATQKKVAGKGIVKKNAVTKNGNIVKKSSQPLVNKSVSKFESKTITGTIGKHVVSKPSLLKKNVPASSKPSVKPIEPKILKSSTNNPASGKPETVKPVSKELAAKPAEPLQNQMSTPAPVKPVQKKSIPDIKPTKLVMPDIKTKTVRKYEPEFTKSVLDTPMQEQSGPSQRYSDNELTEFRDLINKKLDAAKKELNYLQGLITRKDEMGGDESDNRYMTMEDGSISMEREQLSQMASRQITFIDHLEKAIMRIENKTYGICRVTGKLIDKARLRAVPHATLSIEAKQTMNR